MRVSRGIETPEAVPIDIGRVLEEIGGDEAFLRELLDEFAAIARDQLVTLHEAVGNGQAAVVAQEAHAIKGGAANLRAVELSAVAATLESVARTGLLENADDVLKCLEDALGRFESFAKDWTPSKSIVPADVAEQLRGERGENHEDPGCR